MFTRGEVDLRASYCAACIATVFDLDAARIFPVECMKFIGRCQSLDGGISSNIHGSEGHGGYVSCGFLAMLLMHCLRENQKRRQREKEAAFNEKTNQQKQKFNDIKSELNEETTAERTSPKPSLPSLLSVSVISENYCLDVSQLRRWCALRQDPCVGAFSGRVNKLVDSCYSWWVGGTLASLALVDAAEDVLELLLEKNVHDDEGNNQGEDTDSVDDDSSESNHISESMKKMMKVRSLSLTQHAMLLPRCVTKEILQKKILSSFANQKVDDDDNDDQQKLDDDGLNDENENDKSEEEGIPCSQNMNNIVNNTNNTQWLDESLDDGGDYAYNQDRLAEYVLELAQTRFGGLADKPDMKPDLYHTCYSLSGLAISVAEKEEETAEEFKAMLSSLAQEEEEEEDKETREQGELIIALDKLMKEAYQFQHFDASEPLKQNPFQTTHPLLNLTRKRVKFALEFFGGRDSLL